MAWLVSIHLSAGQLQALSICHPGRNLRPKGVPKVAIRFSVWDVAHKRLRTTLKGSADASMEDPFRVRRTHLKCSFP